jgi:DNA-binding LacI/PurR family transcriptional regulator
VVAPAGDAFDAGRSALRALLGDDGRPAVEAAAFANDPLACGALLEARRLGVPVPGALALLGFGDFAIGRQLEPALSTVRLPRAEIGAEAARTVLAALRDGAPARSRTLPWTLLPRDSTAAVSAKGG